MGAGNRLRQPADGFGESPVNFFSTKSAATRYAIGRPYFHPLVIRRVKEYLRLPEPVSRGLDVCCGTGLSTTALKEISREVVGVDVSSEMLAQRLKHSGVEYLVADAENLSFADRIFGLVTVSQAFHWLDRTRVLGEAGRVLRPGGWLIVYDNYFAYQMSGCPEFQTWYEKSYLKRYPVPPRAWASFTVENTESEGFCLLGHEWLENTIIFSIKGLIDFLVTQSNIIASVEGGRESIDTARGWLTESLRPLFGSRNEAEFLFTAPIWYLRPSDKKRSSPAPLSQ
jgi:SAM-dependent methyltransferase